MVGEVGFEPTVCWVKASWFATNLLSNIETLYTGVSFIFLVIRLVSRSEIKYTNPIWVFSSTGLPQNNPLASDIRCVKSFSEALSAIILIASLSSVGRFGILVSDIRIIKLWCGRWDLNPQRIQSQCIALPLSYLHRIIYILFEFFC